MTDERRPPRHELPADADALAPMGAAFEEALERGLDELGLADTVAASARARRSYEHHARLLREWNDAINLTAIREPADVARRHTCDSLSAVPWLAGMVHPGTTLLDLGSGGGYPGLPLAAALPLARVALLDSVAKKARFLAVAAVAVRAALEDSNESSDGIAVVGVPHVEAIAERAEDLAGEPVHRGAWDLVTARAVGSLAEVLELGLPLAREGGAVVAWKREDGKHTLRQELREAGSIIRAAGGGRPEVATIDATFLPGHRLVLVRKERPTPSAYPRAAGERRGRRR